MEKIGIGKFVVLGTILLLVLTSCAAPQPTQTTSPSATPTGK